GPGHGARPPTLWPGLRTGPRGPTAGLPPRCGPVSGPGPRCGPVSGPGHGARPQVSCYGPESHVVARSPDRATGPDRRSPATARKAAPNPAVACGGVVRRPRPNGGPRPNGEFSRGKVFWGWTENKQNNSAWFDQYREKPFTQAVEQ